MIPEAAKRFVEQIGFEEKSKSLLSSCFVHRCHVIHLLRREMSKTVINTDKKPLWRIAAFYENETFE